MYDLSKISVSPEEDERRPRPNASPSAASVEARIARLAAGCLLRPRLFTGESNRTRCRLFRAPQGYGKSVAMAQYWTLQRSARTTGAWISLKDCRGEPQEVLLRLSRQLDEGLANSGRGARLFPTTERPSDLRHLAECLWEFREKHGSTLLIVFDDLDFDPQCVDLVEEFMMATPNEIQFLVATSGDTGFARIKARQEIIEQGYGALAFSLDEAKAVARNTEGLSFSESDIQPTWKRTEGWPAIFCLSLQTTSDLGTAHHRHAVDRLTGTDIDLKRYFQTTVLDFLDEDEIEFCVCASAIGREVSAAYFNFVFLRNDAAYYIDKLARERMLLRPLTRSQSAYEFHPLLREFLEDRFSVTHGLSASEILDRAAQWQRRQNKSRESINLSIRSGQTASAAEVASETMMDIALRQGDIDQIRSWQNEFSAAIIAETPMIALGLAWSQIFSHGHKQAADLLAGLQAQNRGDGDQATREKMTCWRDLIAAIGEATDDNLMESRRQCEAWLKRYDDADLVSKGAILTCLCFIAASENRFDDQKALGIGATAINNISDHHYALGWLHSANVFAALSKGDVLLGKDLLRMAREDDHAQIASTPFSASLLNALELELRYEANQLEGIEESADAALDFTQQHGIVDFTFAAYRTGAAIARNKGDTEKAVGLLQEMRAIAAELGFSRLDTLASLTLADMFVVESAEQAIAILPNRSAPLFFASHGPYLRARQSLTEARIAARQGKFHLSNRLANVALDHARRFGLGRLEVAALLCTAVAVAGTGKTTLAEQRIADAIDLGSRLGCYRTLFDERWYIETLGTISTPLLNLILSQETTGFRDPMPGRRDIRSLGNWASVTLTKKEIAILHKIRDGLSNRDIASAHHISEDTVKWHIRNIFTKLKVKNRVQALIKAERAGLVR